MERLFLREKTEDKSSYIVEKQKVGITGISKGAGASFIAMSIAKVLSHYEDRRVTYLEVNDLVASNVSLIYDAIGFDKRFKSRKFESVYSEVISGSNIKGKTNFDDKINWALITPEDIKNEIKVTPIDMIRLINNVSGDTIVCDIARCQHAEDYLLDMDVIVCVIDPIPSAMIAGFPFLKEIKRIEYRGKKIVWVINKFNSGINKRDMHSFLKLKDYYKIPALEAEDFYSAEYNCKVPYEMSNIRDKMKDTIEKIITKELKT